MMGMTGMTGFLRLEVMFMTGMTGCLPLGLAFMTNTDDGYAWELVLNIHCWFFWEG